MGSTEPSNTPIISIQCSSCHKSTIYLKVKNHQNNHAPFKNNEFTCTECTQQLKAAGNDRKRPGQLSMA
ncbi:hypothetical protein [Marinicella meishanensis]|uniref:hypothetical protein n=1 Tax=Marinicella meishanensis TaxID=2873263 RepID=UPI001CBF88FA|nr:hypothetical protein [Marinicella sp. NBU2979]